MQQPLTVQIYYKGKVNILLLQAVLNGWALRLQAKL